MSDATDHTTAHVVALKEEGNRLFAGKKFKDALDKYTAAIALDEQNAILWANRSACNLKLRQYLDACGDAVKARTLDKTYYKAYAREATAYDAMHEYMMSTRAWKEALDVMPSENLTPAQQTQRDEYQARLTEAKLRNGIKSAAVGAGLSPNTRIYGNEGGQPWDIASEMIVDIRRRKQARSCVWVIDEAAKMFKEGVRKMFTVHIVRNENGEPQPSSGEHVFPQTEGEEGGLFLICKAFLQERRILHLEKMDLWIDAYNLSGTFERQMHNPWLGVGPDTVQREVAGRLAKVGWDQLRPDLDLTIRFWLIRGAIEHVTDNNHRSTIEYSRQALRLVEWGYKKFKDVPIEDKGEVFSKISLRAIRNHHMLVLHQAYGTSQRTEADRKEYLESCTQLADLLLKELDSDDGEQKYADEHTPGDYLAHYDYIRGRAYSMKAFYHAQCRERATSRDIFIQESKKSYRCYIKAADSYPIDDEEHYAHLSYALQQSKAGIDISGREILALHKRARESFDISAKIWLAHPSRLRPEAVRAHENMRNSEQGLLRMIESVPEGQIREFFLDQPVTSVYPPGL